MTEETEIIPVSTVAETEIAEPRKPRKPRVNGTRELAKVEDAPAPAPVSGGDAFLAMIERAARDPSVDIDKMERLFAMRERMQARDAEAAFNTAMAAAQAELKPVAKNAYNEQTRSKYATLDKIAAAIDPIIHKHGFGHSYGEFASEKPSHHGTICYVTHAAGHSKEFRFEIPTDAAGMKGNVNKTPTHAYGSTSSYGRRYAKLCVWDVALTDDDDGNAAGGQPVEKITAEQADALKALAKKANVDLQVIYEFFRVEDVADLTPAQQRTAVSKINKKLELEGAQ
jgi:hypothetical protein